MPTSNSTLKFLFIIIPLQVMCLFYSGCLQNFLFALDFQQFGYNKPKYSVVFQFICLCDIYPIGVPCTLCVSLLSFIMFEKFLAILPSGTLAPFHSFSSLSTQFQLRIFRPPDIVSQLLGVLFFFPFFLLLYFSVCVSVCVISIG